MWNGKKIIVSMTSYPKRIKNVPFCCFLLSKQTIRPDEIHVWLSQDEFKNAEEDLPTDFIKMTQAKYIKLHWLPNNTYCFKRHEIFKELNGRYYCFFIDDDVMYDCKLIETVLTISDNVSNSIINYTDYGKINYIGKHASPIHPAYNFSTQNNAWCGQSMIPSWIYPMDALDQNNIKIRDKICPLCDETWMTQFFIKHKIGIYNAHLSWGIELNNENCNKIGIIQQAKRLDSDGLNFRDKCLIKLFNYFPENLQYYKENFNYA